MTPLLCIPLMAVLNHIRGQWGDRLPLMHPRFWVLPFVGLTAWIALPWHWALYFAACWLVSQWLGWTRWYDLGHWGGVAAKQSWFENLIDRVPGGDYVKFTVRNTLCSLPFAAINPWLILLGPGQTLAYAIGWMIAPSYGNKPGEWITGAMHGGALVWLSYSNFTL